MREEVFSEALNTVVALLPDLQPLELLLKLLKKNVAIVWNEDCQIAVEKIKTYMMNPLLVMPVSGRALLMYLAIHNFLMGRVLGQHDEIGEKEQAIFYLSKKFAKYRFWCPTLEKPCALV